MAMCWTVSDCASGYRVGDSEQASCGVRAGQNNQALQSHSEWETVSLPESFTSAILGLSGQASFVWPNFTEDYECTNTKSDKFNSAFFHSILVLLSPVALIPL